MASHQPGVWGIDLGLCALKAIRLQVSDGAVTATAFDYIEHPKILSQPDADPDQLTRDALETFLSRNAIKGDMIVISVPGQSGLARFVKLPPVEERKIADIVKFEAKQQIPFPLDEVVWDFQKIGTPMVTDGLALETEIGLFAMKKDMVNRALTQFKEVNVEVHIVQMAPLALINYLAYDALGKNPKKPGEETEDTGETHCVVALDIGTDNSNLVITDGEKIIWQRPIPLGGNHFTRALTKDMKLTFAKAEHLKRNAAKSPDLKKILSSLKTVLSDFVGEVQRSLGYFTNTHRDANIKYMVGLGGAFRLPGLQKFLQEKLQLEVRKVSRFDRLKGDDVTVSPQFNENILSFAVPYGLAIQGLKLSKLQTNLLPYDVRVERLVRGKKPWAAAAAACLLVAIAGLTYGKSLERQAITGPEIKSGISAIDTVKSDISQKDKDFKDAEEKLAKSAEGRRQLVAGVEERLNWQLLAQYINLTLPQPNGNRLAELSSKFVPVKEKYYDEKAKEAFTKLEARRTPTKSDKQKLDPAIALRDDEFIKKHLVQISIEGIHALYCDDVPGFFKNVYSQAPILKYMEEDEVPIVKAAAEKPFAELPDEIKKRIPEKAWVVEIRGYTYHQDGEDFLKNTLVENLRYPEMVNADIFPQLRGERLLKWRRAGGSDRIKAGPKEGKFREQILQQLGFLFLYKSEFVDNPEPGNFLHIKGSYLPALLKPPAMVNLPGAGPGVDAPPPAPAEGQDPMATPKISRDSWKPIGDIASAAHTAGPALVGVGGGGFGRGPVNPGPVIPPPMPKGKGLLDKGPAFVIEKQPRREFVVLFLWKEPLRSLEPPPAPKVE